MSAKISFYRKRCMSLLCFCFCCCCLFCFVFSLFPAPCTSQSLTHLYLRRLFAFGKYSGHLANVRKITQKSEPCLSQASQLPTDGGYRRRPRGGRKDKRLHNVVFRNSFLFFPHTHFLWGEKGHRQGTYRESSLRGLLIIKFYQLYVFSVAVRQLSSSIWASQPALLLQHFLFKLFCSYPSVLSCRSNSIEFKGEVGILKRVPYIVESCGINCKLRVPSSSWRVLHTTCLLQNKPKAVQLSYF